MSASLGYLLTSPRSMEGVVEKQPLLLELLVGTVPEGGSNSSLAIKQSQERSFNPFCASRQRHRETKQGASGPLMRRRQRMGGRRKKKCSR